LIFQRKPSQFHETFYDIKSLFHPYIKELAINVTIDGRQFSYPFFKHLKPNVMETKTSKKHDEIPKLNKAQLKLLSILSDNSRTPLIDIAQKLKTTEKTVTTYIRQLEKDKIILNHTCQLHSGRAGYFFYLITIRLNKPNKELEEYLSKIPEIFYIVRGAGFYDIKSEFYTETEQRAHNIKEDLLKKFGKDIVEI
jgi:DNA-binding Lrp family transcriptional regulator